MHRNLHLLACLTSSVLVMALTPASAQTQGPRLYNILPNGDFEAAEEVTPTNDKGKAVANRMVTAKDWTALIGPLPQIVTWGNDPKESPKGGARFLRIKDESPKDPVAVESPRMPAQTGVNYGAAVWVRSQDAGDPALYLTLRSPE